MAAVLNLLNGILLSIICLSTDSARAASCYRPDGNLLGNEYQPCNQIRGFDSTCCGTNKTDFPEFCLANGLCERNDGAVYYREGCSRQNFTGVCLDICSGPGNLTDGNDNIRMTPCDGTVTSETWCCGDQNTTCCGDSNKAITLAPTFGISSTSATGAATVITVTASQPSGTNAQDATQPNTQQVSSGVSGGAAAGIAIGTLVAGILIGALVSWFVAKRQARRNQGLHATSSTFPQQSSNRQKGYPMQKSEPTTTTSAHELGVVRPPAELDSEERD